ncbi:hypothetical protein GGQ88_002652 [Novosphingobium hassiacum]|uniref:Uncharacterized protein n=1 Tax=Novosphingobium hassiacum TaxID=173676 RepID=A0A7W5ZWR5_9SPHN|nr:hypothetical protein [Novosphingobium hassiacum]MBB3861368.1 hypothetical protein [Novosphingobium hassiacum]
MSNESLDRFKSLFADLGAALPPAPLKVICLLGELDLNAVYTREPDFLLDLTLRITADSILACYDMVGPAKADYLGALRLISLKLNFIANQEVENSELLTYLSKLDSQLDEFNI